MAKERWQQVGEELGLELPEYVGSLVLPLFDRERSGGPSIVETPLGLVVARLVEGDGLNGAGMPNRKLVMAAAGTAEGLKGWATVETHMPRKLPEGPYGSVLCRIDDFGHGRLWRHVAPRTGAMAGTELERDGSVDEQMRDRAVAGLDPLVQGQGIDLFNPDNAETAREALEGDFAGHIFDRWARDAIQGQLGIEPAVPQPIAWA